MLRHASFVMAGLAAVGLLVGIGMAIRAHIRRAGRLAAPPGEGPGPIRLGSVPARTDDVGAASRSWRMLRWLLALPLLVPIAALVFLVIAIALLAWFAAVFLIHRAYWLRWKLLGIPMPYRRQWESDADDRFWSIIEADGGSIRDEPEQQLEAIRSRLRQKRPGYADLAEFRAHLARRMADACTADLRAACLLIHGRDSEEDFANFRAWLVARGESIYRAALLDADSLADVVEPYRDDCRLAGLRAVAEEVLREVANDGFFQGPAAIPPATMECGWDFGDPEQVSRRLPRLAALYLA
ncbi:hypothetical protein OJF2_63660 [Aquisphaera giovannonii]|uniref:DUF4240 domain-containing protein n=1 Tax=Aquisphaera giovannonii TaxID=406548 RepID=A0A5B9WCJ6_9BACT|nr:DUF4240 domain-containing protein [Aquisphaera giovannonii]QEH37775.1 hypothetical protein OJF2_63660 [Aquisphaera giovannonii]